MLSAQCSGVCGSLFLLKLWLSILLQDADAAIVSKVNSAPTMNRQRQRQKEDSSRLPQRKQSLQLDSDDDFQQRLISSNQPAEAYELNEVGAAFQVRGRQRRGSQDKTRLNGAVSVRNRRGNNELFLNEFHCFWMHNKLNSFIVCRCRMQWSDLKVQRVQNLPLTCNESVWRGAYSLWPMANFRPRELFLLLFRALQKWLYIESESNNVC